MFEQINILPFFKNKKNSLALLGILIGLCLIFFGFSLLTTSQNDNSAPILVDHKDSSREKIVVEIAGAVNKPGIYRVETGDRISDLLRKSDGVSKKADVYKFATTINLAQKLADSEKIYVPFLEESGGELENNGLISINNASQSQLETLDGIGEKRALEIILQRPYQSLEELRDKEVLSDSLFEKNKRQLKL